MTLLGCSNRRKAFQFKATLVRLMRLGLICRVTQGLFFCQPTVPARVHLNAPDSVAAIAFGPCSGPSLRGNPWWSKGDEDAPEIHILYCCSSRYLYYCQGTVTFNNIHSSPTSAESLQPYSPHLPSRRFRASVFDSAGTNWTSLLRLGHFGLSRSAECERLETASKLPPVTKANLSELDLSWIMHNIGLRVDVNYDHDLHFMPIQGPSGERKRQGAKNYWLALATEFRIYQHSLTQCPFCQVIGEQHSKFFKPRLPDMFMTLRELLETLVPDRDHSRIAENLDIPLLMQQVEKGVLDIVRLSQWIAELLKSHCAPMRDEWADEMASRVEVGCLCSDMDIIVDGLQKLFSFLEAMKLDVANHQIRTFRFPLIEDTVPFQKKYFGRKLREKKISPHASRVWYQKVRGDHQKCLSRDEQAPKIEPLGALIHGILRECTEPEHTPEWPETFAYDRLRLNQLREDVQDIIYLRICVQAFNNFVYGRFGDRRVRPKNHATLQGRIIILIENDDSEPRCDRWQGQIEDVAMEITRAAYAEYGLEHLPIEDCEFECTTRLLERAFRENFTFLANELHAKLEQITLTHASVFQDQSPLHISEAQKHWQQSRQDDKLWQADPEDIARRIAHMAVLHWRVWAGLVYLDGEENNTFESDSGTKEDAGSDGQNQLLLGSGGEGESESGEPLAVDQVSLVGDGDGNT